MTATRSGGNSLLRREVENMTKRQLTRIKTLESLVKRHHELLGMYISAPVMYKALKSTLELPYPTKHHSLCYGVIRPHKDCECCKALIIRHSVLKALRQAEGIKGEEMKWFIGQFENGYYGFQQKGCPPRYTSKYEMECIREMREALNGILLVAIPIGDAEFEFEKRYFGKFKVHGNRLEAVVDVLNKMTGNHEAPI